MGDQIIVAGQSCNNTQELIKAGIWVSSREPLKKHVIELRQYKPKIEWAMNNAVIAYTKHNLSLLLVLFKTNARIMFKTTGTFQLRNAIHKLQL